MARRLCPDVPWRGGSDYDADPWTALVRGRAGEALGWQPRFTWRRWLAESGVRPAGLGKGIIGAVTGPSAR